MTNKAAIGIPSQAAGKGFAGLKAWVKNAL